MTGKNEVEQFLQAVDIIVNPDKNPALKVEMTGPASDWIKNWSEIVKNHKTEKLKTVNGQQHYRIPLDDRFNLMSQKHDIAKAFNILLYRDTPNVPPLIDANLGLALESSLVVDKDGVPKFDRNLAVDLIMEKIKFVYLNEKLLYYDTESGVWQNGAELIIKNILGRFLWKFVSSHTENEILASIKMRSVRLDDFNSMDGYINLLNGVYEMSTGRLLPHDAKYHFRHCINVKFDYYASPNEILKFFESIFADNYVKALKLLEFYSYPFIQGYPIQKAMILLGNGSNGKSTALGILSNMLGEENTSAIPLQTLANDQFAASNLAGKIANIAPDISNSVIEDSSTFKTLTGGDLISLRKMYIQNRNNYHNTAKLLFALNQLPESRDRTDAYYRRYEILKLVMTFTGIEDPTILSKLTEPKEISGLFNVLTRIFIPALQKKLKFILPLSLNELKYEYNLSANTPLAFFESHLKEDSHGEIIAEDLYNRYSAWCNENGLNTVSTQSFGYSLMNRSGLLVQRKRMQKKGVQKYFYTGIKFIPDNTNNSDDSEKYLKFASVQAAINYYAEGNYDFVRHIGDSTSGENDINDNHSDDDNSSGVSTSTVNTSTFNSKLNSYDYTDVPPGAVKDELVQDKEDIENEKLKRQEDKLKQQPAETVPENANQEITKDFIEEIREKLETENFMLDGNHGLSFDKKDFQLYVHPTELSMERFIHLKEIMKSFGFQYSLIQAPYGIRFIRKIRGGVNE